MFFNIKDCTPIVYHIGVLNFSDVFADVSELPIYLCRMKLGKWYIEGSELGNTIVTFNKDNGFVMFDTTYFDSPEEALESLHKWYWNKGIKGKKVMYDS